MSLRPLVTLPDARLFLRSEEIKDSDLPDLDILVRDMFDTMNKEMGIGLAAVQIGVLKRIFVMDLSIDFTKSSSDPERDAVLEKYLEAPAESAASDGNDGYIAHCGPTVVINPEILETSKQCVSMEEGCLSMPGLREMVSRPESVVLSYLDQDLTKRTMRATGLLSRCIQHELDHLNGIVFLKHISKLKRDLAMKKFRKAAALH